MYTSALSIFFKKAKFTSVAEKKSQSDFSLTAPLPPTHEKTLAVYAGTNPRRDAARKKSIFPLKRKQTFLLLSVKPPYLIPRNTQRIT